MTRATNRTIVGLRELARQGRFGSGSEGGRFFMPHA
jgi:hypothetical protein